MCPGLRRINWSFRIWGGQYPLPPVLSGSDSPELCVEVTIWWLLDALLSKVTCWCKLCSIITYIKFPISNEFKHPSNFVCTYLITYFIYEENWAKCNQDPKDISKTFGHWTFNSSSIFMSCTGSLILVTKVAYSPITCYQQDSTS